MSSVANCALTLVAARIKARLELLALLSDKDRIKRRVAERPESPLRSHEKL